MIGKSDGKQAEDLLGVRLPAGISAVSYFRWQPSPDLPYFQAYLKFVSTLEQFTALAGALEMEPAHSRTRGHLPACWDGPPGVELPGWDPAPETPKEAVARSYGENGWIVAKRERGATYLILTDSGHAGGTPGPW